MSRFLIYGLVDPRTGHLRYVGKSTSGLRRPQEHLHPSKLEKEKTHKANWIKGLAASGLAPHVVVFEEHPEPSLLYQAEIFWIGYLREAGHPLTNTTDGGAGNLGLRHTDRTKAVISQKLKGRSAPQTVLSNRRRKGVPGSAKSSEHREKLSKARGGRPVIETNTGNRFETIADAARFAKTSTGNVCKILRGIGKNIHGCSFRYA